MWLQAETRLGREPDVSLKNLVFSLSLLLDIFMCFET
jgi:hypothetical protein